METRKLIAVLLILSSPVFAKGSKKSKAPQKSKAPKIWAIEKPKDGEIKVLLDATELDKSIAWLKQQKADFSQEHLFFFDTPDLLLFKSNVILRVRRHQDDTFDVSVKVRDKEITSVPEISNKTKKNFKCELDATSEVVTACTLTKKDKKKILKSIDSQSIESYFDADQKKLIKSKVADLDWKALKVFGRINAAEWVLDPEDSPPLTFELWSLPNGTRFIEASRRFTQELYDKDKTELTDFLKKNGLDISSHSETKTELTLKALSSVTAPTSP